MYSKNLEEVVEETASALENVKELYKRHMLRMFLSKCVVCMNFFIVQTTCQIMFLMTSKKAGVHYFKNSRTLLYFACTCMMHGLNVFY